MAGSSSALEPLTARPAARGEIANLAGVILRPLLRTAMGGGSYLSTFVAGLQHRLMPQSIQLRRPVNLLRACSCRQAAARSRGSYWFRRSGDAFGETVL